MTGAGVIGMDVGRYLADEEYRKFIDALAELVRAYEEQTA